MLRGDKMKIVSTLTNQTFFPIHSMNQICSFSSKLLRELFVAGALFVAVIYIFLFLFFFFF